MHFKKSILASLNSGMYHLGFTDYKLEFQFQNPSYYEVKKNKIIIVGQDISKRAYLKCPCGCGDLIMLSLMKENKPSWNLQIDNLGRPSLLPSIWKIDGCKSHFFVRRGRIKWVVFE
jgi:hypothetical protein